MELSDKHVEAIKTAARSVDYGSVTIQIAANSDRLELNIQNRIRLEKEPTQHKDPAPRKGNGNFQN